MIESGLRTILDNQKISISELSKLTNISRKTLTQLADNKSNGIKFNTLNSLVTALGVNVNEILKFQTDEKLKVSNMTISSDNEITFKTTHSNLATGKESSLPGKTSFMYTDDTFIFSPPELPKDADDPRYRYAFSRLILNWRDSPMSKPQEIQLDKDAKTIKEQVEIASRALTDGKNIDD
ncbi:MAG TPA: helix-turn-helix transcriptional regulator, partial [Candidatus Levilactobacillus faecigallinarum]|nr:helix-turn-helix transcriptional regulator [Candidatus Levilactobacillus faecigallinarum]